MGVQIEELRAYFTANYGNFKTGANAVTSMLNMLDFHFISLGKSIKSTFDSATNVVRTFATEVRDVSVAAENSIKRIALASTALTVKAAKSFADFEMTMTRAGAVTNTLGTRDFKRLQDAAVEMGEKTMFSNTQAAEAIEKLGLAGLKTSEILAALPASLQLAGAAQISISDAAETVSKTMRGFGKDASELEHVNDVLVKAFTSSNQSITEMAEALKYVAPVSTATGVSIEDTVAVIAKLSDAGISASMAGTSLRGIITRLAGGMPELTGKFAALGIQTMDASGNMRPLFDILGDIEKKGLSGGQIMELFGQRAGPGMVALLDGGISSLREYSKELQGAEGFAKKTYDAIMTTLSAQFDELVGGPLETMTAELGKELKPALIDLFKFIAANMPVLKEMARSFALFVDQVIRFAIEHPNLLKMFMLFQAGNLLGINSLLLTLVSSFGSLSLAVAIFSLKATMLYGTLKRLISITGFLGLNKVLASTAAWLARGALSLAAYAAKLTLAKMAMLGLKAAAAGIAVVAIGVFASAIYNASQDIQDFNRELERSINLSLRLAAIQGKRNKKVIDEANRADAISPGKGKEILAAEIAAGEKEIEGLNAAIAGQKKLIEQKQKEFERIDPNSGNGIIIELAQAAGLSTSKVVEGEQANLQDLENKLEQARSRTDELRAAMEKMGTAATEAAAAAAEAIENPPPLVGDGSGTDEALRNAAIAGMEAKSGGGFKDILDFVQGGASATDLEKFLTSTSEGTASEGNTIIDARQKLFDIQSNGGFQNQEQLDEFALEVATAINAAREAEQQLAETRERNAEEEKKRAEEHAEALKQMEPVTKEIKDQLFWLGKETSDSIEKQIESLQDRFALGKMSADEFTDAMRNLKNETDKATAAAKRKMELEIRQRILRGDFSALNWQQALEDKLYQYRMQQFNQGIDNMFNRMMGFSNGMESVSRGFGALSGKMAEFGEHMTPPSSGGDGGGSQIIAWLSSIDGVRASLFNEINLLQQSLRYMQDPRRKQETLDRIGALQNQLSNLHETPYTVGDAFDNVKDPGLSGGGKIEVVLPNISRVTNSDLRQIADGVLRVFEQQGRRV